MVVATTHRAALVALAQKYDFKIIADEAYQLLSFEDPGVVRACRAIAASVAATPLPHLLVRSDFACGVV